MKYGDNIGTVVILGIDIPVFSNGDTGYIANTFLRNASGIKLGMNYQCVQLARIFYYELTGKDSYMICPDLNATCWFRYRNELSLDEVMYDSIKQGDIVIFEGGDYGHIALVRKVEATGFFVVQQNFYNDSRDLNFFISYEKIKNGDSFYDQNDNEFILEDFLRIK